MKRSIPWIIAALCFVAFGASFSELQRMRGRFGEVTRYQVSHRVYYREFLIRSELAEASGPILVIGDSITERAKLPETIDGREVINGGISGATVEDFEQIAAALIQHRPFFLAVALGSNNTAETLRTAYPALLAQLKVLAPHLLAVGVTPQDGADLKNAEIKAAADREGVRFIEMPLPNGSTQPDRVHLNAAGYQKWTPALVSAIRNLLSG
jgi:lysophospholipase L1-like esterase